MIFRHTAAFLVLLCGCSLTLDFDEGKPTMDGGIDAVGVDRAEIDAGLDQGTLDAGVDSRIAETGADAIEEAGADTGGDAGLCQLCGTIRPCTPDQASYEGGWLEVTYDGAGAAPINVGMCDAFCGGPVECKTELSTGERHDPTARVYSYKRVADLAPGCYSVYLEAQTDVEGRVRLPETECALTVRPPL